MSFVPTSCSAWFSDSYLPIHTAETYVDATYIMPHTTNLRSAMHSLHPLDPLNTRCRGWFKTHRWSVPMCFYHYTPRSWTDIAPEKIPKPKRKPDGLPSIMAFRGKLAVKNVQGDMYEKRKPLRELVTVFVSKIWPFSSLRIYHPGMFLLKKLAKNYPGKISS